MRLWHYKLLPYLDNKRLVRQHCECCALRGKGWGRKHKTVDYVFKHDAVYLVAYHFQVMHEMMNRGYKVDVKWWSASYRGQNSLPILCASIKTDQYLLTYPEHDKEYLQQCLIRLAEKGMPIIDTIKALKENGDL